MVDDRPLLGIALMTGFCVLAPLGDAISKILVETIPLFEIIFVRFTMQVVLLLPLVFRSNISMAMRPRIFRLTFIRTILHIIGVGVMITSLRFLPLADAIAIAFVMPFIMLVLGYFVLNEVVGLRRILACCVGFIGTLLVIQPSFASVGAPALLPLGVAVVFALFILVTRKIAKEVDPIALQATSGIMAIGILSICMLVFSTSLPQHFQLKMPSGHETLLLLLIGVIGTIAHLFMTWSLRYAPSATLAPMQYLEIPFATAIGWMIFRDLPNGLAAIGILITCASGLYIVYRERVTARALPSS